MSRPEHLEGLSYNFRQSITVHVRLGDYRRFDDTRMRAGDFNMRLPLTWVAETIRDLREGLEAEWPVWLFSDGSDSDLRELMVLPKVHRVTFGSALADMLAMSKSDVLIVSSSFSMWSAFLGSVPSIYYPGQLRQSLIPDHKGREIEREPGASVDDHFLDILARSKRRTKIG